MALTLREVCGLPTEEISHAFLTVPATLAQRIVRANAKIRDARKVSITGGPYAETKEQLGGILVLEAPDLNRAIQRLLWAPAARNMYGTFDSVRSRRLASAMPIRFTFLRLSDLSPLLPFFRAPSSRAGLRFPQIPIIRASVGLGRPWSAPITRALGDLRRSTPRRRLRRQSADH